MTDELVSSIVDKIESRIVYYWTESWCTFLARIFLYFITLCVLLSSVLLYKFKNINATDFGYMVPLSGLSSAALLYVSTFFKQQSKSELLLDVSVDLLSDFLPTYSKKSKSKITCRKES
jgi:hypothetical protein